MEKKYSQKEILDIMEKYNNIDRKIIKTNLVKIYRTNGFRNRNIVSELNMAKAKVDSWTTMCMPNIPTFYDAMRISVHFNIDIKDFIKE